eukprot:SAG31_NODE_2533_length_5554_cov_2.350623_7_plen_121_part_01
MEMAFAMHSMVTVSKRRFNPQPATRVNPVPQPATLFALAADGRQPGRDARHDTGRDQGTDQGCKQTTRRKLLGSASATLRVMRPRRTGAGVQPVPLEAAVLSIAFLTVCAAVCLRRAVIMW